MKPWQDKLEHHKSTGLWRTHKIRSGPQSNNFNSNDYLGMSNHPDVIQAFKQAVDQYGVGSGSANTLSGYTQAHDELREQLKDWLGRDDVLLFSSGYQANLALLTTLISPKDHIFADKLNHASLIDGMLFSKAKFTRYPHLDIDKIRSGATCCASQHWIITESLFSMDGDEADLKKLATFSDRATLIIDEAHSLGLYGPEGAGLIAANNLTQQQAPIMIGTFGKSIGTQGAFIAGDQAYIDALMQFARPYLFTTAMAPALAAASTASIQLIRTMNEERAYIFSLIQDFRAKAQDLNLILGNSTSPIQPILFNDIALVNRLSERLNQFNLGVSSIRYPTVSMDAPRLRITLSINHTKEHITRFFEHLQEALDEETSHTSCL
jgi:8-amino-7-oxononanoate synthase